LAWALGCLALLKPASVVMVIVIACIPGQALFSCAPFNAKANCLVSEATEEGCYLFCWYNSLRPFGESTVTVYWIGDISSKDAMNESTV
jgi:hypothetical protein